MRNFVSVCFIFSDHVYTSDDALNELFFSSIINRLMRQAITHCCYIVREVMIYESNHVR